MEEITKPKIRALYLDDKYGKFAIEPLERGFGHTLGNAFRRISLAHINGAAVTDVRINGVLHEFSTIAGVVEDSTEIILNIKEIAVRLVEDVDPMDEVVMHIRAKGPGEILASDIEAPSSVQIVNPELHIAEISGDDTELEIDMWVEAGRGYVLAEERQRGRRAVDVLPIDSVFSPIHRANYRVEPTRLGSRTDLDRLVLELWGDGSVAPDVALQMAAQELWAYVRIFLDVSDELIEEEKETVEAEPVMDRHMDIPIEDVDFSVRTFNCLKKESVDTIGELVKRTEEELLAIRNFGKRSLEEVIQKLEGFGLHLADSGDQHE